MSGHPYRDLDPLHFWSRSVAPIAFHELDPMRSASFSVSSTDQVATLGSCFAQHLSRFLDRAGLNYFIAEEGGEELSGEERIRRNYGTFSARYGNVYTVRQAVQLFERAYGRREEGSEEIWFRDGVAVDCVRPQVEPDGFLDEEALRRDRVIHLAAVRRVFEDADVLVFTLGLTEGWRIRENGLILPVVPGASGGTYDAERYEFVNFRVHEVIADLGTFVELVRSVNPACRIILTVSPVPLIATFTEEHVLSATTYSKSVLRVAAAEIAASFPLVEYFPSFEVIVNSSAGGRYFADDLRSVTDEGVAHAMRVFAHHFLDQAPTIPGNGFEASIRGEIGRVSQIVCDEEILGT